MITTAFKFLVIFDVRCRYKMFPHTCCLNFISVSTYTTTLAAAWPSGDGRGDQVKNRTKQTGALEKSQLSLVWFTRRLGTTPHSNLLMKNKIWNIICFTTLSRYLPARFATLSSCHVGCDNERRIGLSPGWGTNMSASSVTQLFPHVPRYLPRKSHYCVIYNCKFEASK
jgi:hypothetical protein